MRHWFNRNYKTIIITAFLLPIVTVALVSISHVTTWYGISNPISWAIFLSVGIEVAALSALAAIAANMGKNVYFPFIIVTLLQFIGNVFFSYNFIDVTSPTFKSWVELVSPILQFMGVEPTDVMGHKRFLSFFAGGMLPVISLSFLHMLIKFTEADRLKDLAEEKMNTPVPESQVIEAKDLMSDISRIRLTEDELMALESLLNSNQSNFYENEEETENYSDPDNESIELSEPVTDHVTDHVTEQVTEQVTEESVELSEGEHIPVNEDEIKKKS